MPVGLASMVPGAQLAVLLGSVDRSRVGCDELPDLVAARARLAARTEAELSRNFGLNDTDCAGRWQESDIS